MIEVQCRRCSANAVKPEWMKFRCYPDAKSAFDAVKTMERKNPKFEYRVKPEENDANRNGQEQPQGSDEAVEEVAR